MAIDPVCGMQVDEKTPFKLEEEGESHYFCSQNCMDKFKRGPAISESFHEMGKKDIIGIIGMHCASCVSAIENALKKTNGVYDAKVNLGTEKAVVRFNPDKIGIEELHRVINRAGYKTIRESQGSSLDE